MRSIITEPKTTVTEVKEGGGLTTHAIGCLTRMLEDKQKTTRNADFCASFQRNLPARGFKPATLLAIGGGVMLYGWYYYGKGAREQRYVLVNTTFETISSSFPVPPGPPPGGGGLASTCLDPVSEDELSH